MNLPELALSQHIAVLGKTGSGKTSTSKLIVEHAVAEGHRVCVLDPTKSDWWGITSSASGKRPGLPFRVLGGPRGHVALHSGAGKVIGELVANGKLPLSILDMADFEPGGLQRFFHDFAPSLLHHMRGVLYLVVEEAHEFAPKERSGFGQENMAIYYAKKLATAGRSKGIRMIVATQRTQALHNAVLGSCETMIVHRLTSPADQKPLIGWLQSNVSDDKIRMAVEQEMSSLPTGTAWVCSGEAKFFKRVAFPRITTFDNTATPDKDSAVIKVATAPVDPEELRSIIGDAVKDAEANDPKRLRAEIEKLKRELSALPTVQKPEIQIKEVSVLSKENVALLEKSCQEIQSFRTLIDHNIRESLTTMDRMAAMVSELSKPATPVRPFVRVSPPVRKVNSETGRISFSTNEKISGGKQRMMIALAQRPGLNRRQLGLRSGLSSKSGTFTTYLGDLRTRGLVTNNGDCFQLTPEGVAALGDYTPLPEGRELLNHYLKELGDSGTSRMLYALSRCYPAEMTREELAQHAGLSAGSGTFTTYLGKLRTLELVTGKTNLRMSEELA
jgi:uncharacterized protein